MLGAAAIAVFVAALAALALPLLRRSGSVAATAVPSGADGAATTTGLLDEREATLAALHELDFDYATGKLAEADYQALRTGYERRALALLKATDPGAVKPAPPVYRNGLVAHPAGAPHRNGVAGASAPERGRHGSQRGRRVALLAGALGAVFVVGVAGVYVLGNRSQSEQRPVATLAGVGPRALALASGEPRQAFLAAAAGLLSSDDAGASWQPVPSLDRALRAVALSPARPARAYAAGPGVLAVSEDGGRSWATRPVTLPDAEASAPGGADVRALAADPANADRLWLVVEGRGLYRSDDGGQNWTQAAPDVPANATALVVIREPGAAASGTSEPPLLYLASATEGVLASADAGRTWAPASGTLNGALPTRRVSSLVFDSTSGDTATAPDGRILRGTLYAGTEDGLFRSVDRGLSWAGLSLTAAVAAVAAGGEPGAGTLLAADREGAIYRSRDRGVTWDGT